MLREYTELTPFFFVTQSTAYAATNSGIIIVGSEACLIDPAVTPDEIMAIATFVQDRGAIVRTILLTHGHWDHILGPVHFPDAQLITHVTYLDTVKEQGPGLHASLASWERETGIVRDTPFIVPQPDTVFDRSLSFQVGAETFDLIHAPGHHRDLYVVYHPVSALLWASDMLSDLEIPFVEQHLGDYRTTLAKLSDLNVAKLVPGHGNWTANHDDIRARFTQDQTYLAQVDETVRACLGEGWDVEQTVERCSGIFVRHPEQNTQAHRVNVESAWLELGGEDDRATLGWRKYY